MGYTICASNHAEWFRLGLAEFSEFSECINECNMGEDEFSGYGEWWYVPDEPLPSGERVIYFGSWGNDNSPGASHYTFATLFAASDPEEMAEFTLRVQNLEAQPEFDDQPEDGADD